VQIFRPLEMFYKETAIFIEIAKSSHRKLFKTPASLTELLLPLDRSISIPFKLRILMVHLKKSAQVRSTTHSFN